MERIPFTPEGYASIRKELDHLKSVVRPENIQAIEDARAHGDLSENAEYHAAKERQGFIEGRIMDLQYKIASAEVIDPSTVNSDKVVFASRVLLENVDTEESVEYQIVGPEESDIEKGRISMGSPLGKAIIGKRAGDEIVLEAPAGKRIYELVEIL